MALINTTPNTLIPHLTKEDTMIKVGAVYIVPTQQHKTTTNVQVLLLRAIKEGEESCIEVNGYVPTADCGLFNLGEAPTSGDKTTYWTDLHTYAISKLGNNFERIVNPI